MVRLLALTLACLLAAPPCRSQTRQASAPDAAELLRTADNRIERIRKADAQISVTDDRGKPVRGARVRVEQVRHRFLFGAHVFPLYQYKPDELFTPSQRITPPLVTGERKRLFEERFKELFNFATIGFQWNFYEPQRGQKNSANTDRIVAWCKENNIAVKGHVLVWHTQYPKWLPTEQQAARAAIERYVTEEVTRYKDTIAYWDVINEQAELVSKDPRPVRVNNPIIEWVKQEGVPQVVGQTLEWAHKANPRATLIYNENRFMLDNPAFPSIVAEIAKTRPLGAIGIQSHMYRSEWSMEKAWQHCETYGSLGVPIHFTEVSVLSGELDGYERADEDQQPQPTRPRSSTPEGEQRQADYIEKFYTLLFSHPSVEAITYWDLKDGGITFKLRPVGLLREDLTPKPAYERLRGLIKGKWWTRAELATDKQGAAQVRGFMGRYRVTVKTPKGARTQEFELQPGANRWTIKL